ncbi:MAG: hypothetical protein ACK4PG_06510 [Acetobacteraceae bacterium]
MTDDEIARAAFLREMTGFAALRLLEDLVGRGAGHLSSPLAFSEQSELRRAFAARLARRAW